MHMYVEYVSVIQPQLIVIYYEREQLSNTFLLGVGNEIK